MAATAALSQAVALNKLAAPVSSSSSVLRADSSGFFGIQKLNLLRGQHTSLCLRSNVSLFSSASLSCFARLSLFFFGLVSSLSLLSFPLGGVLRGGV